MPLLLHAVTGFCCCAAGAMQQAPPWGMLMDLPGTGMGAGSGMLLQEPCQQAVISMVQYSLETGFTFPVVQLVEAAW